ncbi:MAG TPA: hypothetical protein VGG97_04340 [Bryobacteraceae bacterium]
MNVEWPRSWPLRSAGDDDHIEAPAWAARRATSSFGRFAALAAIIGALQMQAAVCPAKLPTAGTFIYLSPAGTDNSACGSSETTPCQTLQQAVDRCRGVASCIIVASHGLYSPPASVHITGPVQLFGSCSLGGAPLTRYRTILRGPTLFVASNGAPVQVSGFTILANTNPLPPGTASVALTVDGSNLTLDQTVIVSAAGGNGAPGNHGAAGSPGKPGNNAMHQDGMGGTGGPALACADPGHETSGAGGTGGPVNVVDSSGSIGESYCNPVNSAPAQKGADAGAAQGGKGGGTGQAGCDCVGGVMGATPTPNGNRGDIGGSGAPSATSGAAASDIIGYFNSSLVWAPAAAGGSGGWGLPGGGGGGGGAGGFAAIYEDAGHTDYEGQAGGGGGSGGCGGLGGTGGTQGGASFPIVFRASTLTNSGTNVIVPGPGGNGGRGGDGGPGTAGGEPGQGYAGHWRMIYGWRGRCQGTAPGAGGPGNYGGTGGAGSAGAGGNGGPSYSLAAVDYSGAPPPPAWEYYMPQPGPGGARGDPGGGNGAAAPADTGHPGASGILGAYTHVSVGEPSSGGATSTGPGKHSLSSAENPQPKSNRITRKSNER